MRIIAYRSCQHTIRTGIIGAVQEGGNETEFPDSFQAWEEGEGHKDEESTATWGQAKGGGIQDIVQMQQGGVCWGDLAVIWNSEKGTRKQG